MSRPRNVTALVLLVAFIVPACKAQLGRNVVIPAGTEVDHQMTAIVNADPSQKLALIDQFAQAHSEPDYQLLANEQYVNYYLNAKQYNKVFEYGDKLFAIDPDNYGNAVNMIRAANEKGDTEKLFGYGEKACAIVQRYRASPPPEGTDVDTWTRIKSDKLASIKDNQDYVLQSMLSATYNVKDTGQKAAYFERLAKVAPGTPEGDQSLTMAALSYQQAGNRAKMLDVANGALAKDPNNIGMLLLLADDYSEKPDQVEKAETYAKKAASLVDTVKKPDGYSDDQWTQQTSMQKGLALSALGMVNLQKRMNAQAVDNLIKAAPLLKANPTIYARNQFRLGYAYLNLKKNADAKRAFTDAASVESPYKLKAQEKLAEIAASRKKPS